MTLAGCIHRSKFSDELFSSENSTPVFLLAQHTYRILYLTPSWARAWWNTGCISDFERVSNYLTSSPRDRKDFSRSFYRSLIGNIDAKYRRLDVANNKKSNVDILVFTLVVCSFHPRNSLRSVVLFLPSRLPPANRTTSRTANIPTR